MIFEKRNAINTNSLLDITGYTIAIIALTATITYGVTNFAWSQNPTTPLDILNAIAQVATAATLALLIRQHINNSQALRQRDICTEAKDQIKKMISTIEKLETGEKTDIENLDHTLTILANTAINFDELFGSMREDVNKAILRMHWQDMHFNHLMVSLSKLDIFPILKNTSGIKSDLISQLLIFSECSPEYSSAAPQYKNFVKFKRILENDEVQKHLDLRSKLTSLDSFVLHFLVDERLRDYMHGMLNLCDIRSAAPLLAAAKPIDLYSLIKKNKRKNR